MKKHLIALGVLVVAAVGIYLVLRMPHKDMHVMAEPSLLGDTTDIISLSVNPGAVVSNGQEITGSIKGAYFFEANAVGKLLDAQKHVLDTFSIPAKSEWMTAEPVSFAFTLNLVGVAPGPGYIRIQNDNPSGDTTLDKYVDIPVIFQ
jgi:hypothetical protein